MPPFVDKRKLALLITGDEVLYGDIVDTNSGLIAKALEEFGMRPSKKRVVGDDLVGLVTELKELSEEMDLLFINGGMGSTIDDRTNEAVATAFDLKLTENAEARAHLEKIAGKPITEQSVHYKQCLLPEGATTFHNPAGSALGYAKQVGHCLIIATPGPPRELSAMFGDFIVPFLRETLDLGPEGELRRFFVLGIGESRIERMLMEHFKDTNPFEHLRLGFRAVAPMTEVKVWGRPDQLDLLEKTRQQILQLFGSHCFSEGLELPGVISNLLIKRNESFASVESCTGGLMASMITAQPGISAIYWGGLVSYAYEAKETMLGVNHQNLVENGAVSASVAKEMLLGLLETSKAKWGLSITGIAGPTGETPEKPLGTVYIAFGSKEDPQVRHLVIQRDRTQFQHYTSLTALDLLRRQIMRLDPFAPYYFDERTKHQLPHW